MEKKGVAELLEKQRKYFNSNTSREPGFRIEQLERLRTVIEKHEDTILEALYLDLGKSRMEAYISEVGYVYSEINYMKKNLKKFARPVKVKTPLLYFGGSSYIIPEAMGLVLIMGPWNYPFQLMMVPLIGSIAAGNCTVLKPSEHAPRVSVLINAIMKENFAEEYIAVVEGEAETAQNILENKFDYIFFTGSEATGKLVMQAAAKNLTPLCLELGGKSPCIVDQDTNILYTARRIVWGKFLNAGQTCVAPDYLMVDRKIKGELLKNIQDVLKDFYGDDPKSSADYSRIINEQHFLRLSALLKDAELLTGGEQVQAERYIAPTIVDNISVDHPLMQEEIFGPILPVMDYENLEEVIDFLRNKPRPLALYFFSHNTEKQQKIISETISGGVCINDTIIHITNRELPFGGVGLSGMGNYHGKASFDAFSHHKSLLKNSLLFDIPLKYPPYKVPLKWMRRVLKGL